MKKEYNMPIVDIVRLTTEDHFLVGSISGSVSGPVGSNKRDTDSDWNAETDDF